MSELHEAAYAGNLETVEDCLERGLNPGEPDPEWGGKSPLHIASSRGYRKCVLVLLAAGADVNAASETGWTSGHFACETGQADVLSSLLSYNLDLQIGDCSGDTAQRIAEIYDHQNCINVIREHLARQAEARSPTSPRSPRGRPRSPRVKSPRHLTVKGAPSRGREGSPSRERSPSRGIMGSKEKLAKKDKKTQGKKKTVKQHNR